MQDSQSPMNAGGGSVMPQLNSSDFAESISIKGSFVQERTVKRNFPVATCDGTVGGSRCNASNAAPDFFTEGSYSILWSGSVQ